MNKAFKPLGMVLATIMIGFILKIVTYNEDVKSIKSLKKGVSNIQNQDKNISFSILNEKLYQQEKEINNIGFIYIDNMQTFISDEVKQLNLSKKDKIYFLLSLQFLIFEHIFTKEKYNFCINNGIEISGYTELFLEYNKDVRNMIKAYMNAKGLIEKLKHSFNKIIQNEKVISLINKANTSFFNDFKTKFNDDLNQTCKALPMADIIFKDSFLNKITYKYLYQKNYNYLMTR